MDTDCTDDQREYELLEEEEHIGCALPGLLTPDQYATVLVVLGTIAIGAICWCLLRGPRHHVVRNSTRKKADRPQTSELLTPAYLQGCASKLGSLWRQGHLIWDDYVQGRKLGQGMSGTVFLATHRNSTDQGLVAVKAIAKWKVEGLFADEDNVLALQKEFQALAQLQHPNIVRLHAIYDDEHQRDDASGRIIADADGDGIVDGCWYMVMDYNEGGEVVQRLVDGGSYAQKDAASIVRQVAAGLQYAHSMGLVHRDVKPENIMFADSSADSRVVIVDFGVVGFMAAGRPMTASVGTDPFMAPEVWDDQSRREHGYGAPVDLWGLGVVLFMLVFAELPWPKSGRDPSDPLYWRDIDHKKALGGLRDCDLPAMTSQSSASATSRVCNAPLKDLLRRLLDPDPAKRITASDVLAHEWIVSEAAKHTRPVKENAVKLGALLEGRRRAILTRVKTKLRAYTYLVGHRHLGGARTERKASK